MGQLKTRNCTIFFNDVEDGQFRAKAIAATCEYDVHKLATLFGIPFDVDGLNRGGIRVYVISPPGGTASNPGYGGIFGTNDMDINGDYAPAKPDWQTANVRAEFARLLFVAELAEIMMDAKRNGWDRGSSAGEALSIVLATELHPTGYYTAAGGAPRVNAWLKSDRPNWVLRTEGSDTNILSYGCGILFINYLRHQLGFDLSSIIARHRPFAPLADLYAQLTGNPPAQAFPEFIAFLERHLPGATATQQWVGRDDIFPLRPEPNRSVYMSTSSAQIDALRIEPGSFVELKPGFLCPGESEYRYWSVQETGELTASASCAGFGSARFEWSIGRVKLAPTPASALTVQVTTAVTVPQPNRTVIKQAATPVQLVYTISDTWNRSTLRVRNVDNDGVIHLQIGVTATERFVAGESGTSVEGTDDISAFHYEYDPRFAADQRRCNGGIVQMSADLQKMSHQMELVKNAPDPPDSRLAAILEMAANVNARIDAIVEGLGPTGPTFRRELLRSGRIAEEFAAGRGRDLTVEPPVAQTEIAPTT